MKDEALSEKECAGPVYWKIGLHRDLIVFKLNFNLKWSEPIEEREKLHRDCGINCSSFNDLL